jgi:three-Cys-motif partner protein
MVDSSLQQFGGGWTQEKLARVSSYLTAYTNALKNMPFFTLMYIDAFAGTGYRNIKIEDQQGFGLTDLTGEDAKAFHDGSAKIALRTNPRFGEYYFIEQDSVKCSELEKLKVEFPEKATDIHIVNDDANAALKRICASMLKQKNLRAVLFLDPFGMNVSWDTIEAIARTEAIDMWYLFPLGVGVNRLLTKDGNIPESWQKKLDSIFGDTGWRDAFYKKEVITGLFEDFEVTKKTGDLKQISDYFVKRLESIFAGVIKKPLPLYNAKNNPLYLLCFACGNKKGAPIALKIAGHILKRR